MLSGVLAHAQPAAAAPDLVIENLVVDPTSGENGDRIEVTFQVRNQGTSTADETISRVRINTSATTAGPADIALCNRISTPVIAAGAAVDLACSATLEDRPGGVNYIWAIADGNKTAGQSNTDNDRLAIPFTVVRVEPDLIVQSISATPNSIHNGEQVTISVTIKNEGTAAALASKTRFRINQDPSAVSPTDTDLCSGISTPAIPIGASVPVSCTTPITGRPGGTNYIWAIADTNQVNSELDRNNNRGVTPIDVSPEASDLVVDSVVVDPVSGPNGKPVTVTATLRNQGTAQAFASLTRFRMNQDPLTVGGNDFELCRKQTPAIPAGATLEVTCTGTPEEQPPGVNIVWAIADSTGLAGQSDRTNDRLGTEFSVDPPPTPDMTVRSVTVNPTSGPNGASISVSAKISNVGQISSVGSKTRIVFNQNSETVDSDDPVLCLAISTVALSPGGSVSVSCKPTLTDLPVGPGFVWAIADAAFETGQTNLLNDTRSVPFTVLDAAAPDLVIDSVTAAPASSARGAAVTLTARVRNQGDAAAAPSTLRIRLGASAAAVFDTDPILCDAVPTPALAVGASANAVCIWTLTNEPIGSWFLWATADVANTAGQTDRTNDSTKASFTVLPPDAPDLVVQRLVVRPNSTRNGQSVVVRATVANIGTRNAKASVTTFRINTDPNNVSDADEVLCEARPTSALEPGAVVVVRCEALITDRPIGANSVWAIVDTTAKSGQFHTGNDRRSAALTVASADCTDPLASPSMVWPVEQPRVVQDYASFGSVPLAGGKPGYHSGVDLLSHLPIPTDQLPVYAAADGEVVAIRKACPSPADAVVNPPNGTCSSGWGNYVVIRHGDGIYSVYAHLGDVFVRTGCVVQGQRIALAGSSGSTAIPAHLHFGVLADVTEPVERTTLGLEYYRKSHPFTGRAPEKLTGTLRTHLDPRDFMMRSRIGLPAAAVASRGVVTGGVPAYLAKGQEYISYGELVPGYFLIDLPNDTLPEDGPPYADDVRYGWVEASRVEVLESARMPTSARVEGYQVFLLEGVGANFVALRDQPAATSAEVGRVWGDQQFAPTGAAATEPSTGQVWNRIDMPGTSASGAGKPREAWLPADLLGPPPRP